MQFDCQASPMADPSSSSIDNEGKTKGSDISGNRRMDRYGTAAVTGWNVRKGKNGEKKPVFSAGESGKCKHFILLCCYLISCNAGNDLK